MTDLNAGTPGAAAVTIKALPFSSQDPTMWFSILECGFKASRTTQSLTKFTSAASLLPPDVLSQVSDVITSAPTSDTPYEDLKSAVLDRLQTPMAARLRELLSTEELGGEKPSDLLRRMKQLLGDKYQSFDADLFLQLFYQLLPHTIQRGLFTVKDKLQPDELANLADQFMATLPPTQHSPINNISTSQTDTQISQLTSLVYQLKIEVNDLRKQLSERSRSRSPTPYGHGSRQISRRP